jgi:hypothetical protein
MSGKRDQRLRRKSEERKARREIPRGPYRDIGPSAALAAHDRLAKTFFSGLQDRRSGKIQPEEMVARMSYLRGVVFAIKVLKEEMKKDGQAERVPVVVHEAD